MLELPGQFQMLYYDMEGNLHTAVQRWEDTLTLPIGQGSLVEATMWPVGKPQGNLMSGSAQLSADMNLITETTSGSGIPMVTALELGELQEPNPHRPSLILRKPCGQSLWDLAKKHGSTVSAIQEANDLQTEPDGEKVLLIPVI